LKLLGNKLVYILTTIMSLKHHSQHSKMQLLAFIYCGLQEQKWSCLPNYFFLCLNPILNTGQ